MTYPVLIFDLSIGNRNLHGDLLFGLFHRYEHCDSIIFVHLRNFGIGKNL
jgi:hypothetical protein